MRTILDAQTGEQPSEAGARAIAGAIKILLQTKHLYQSVEIQRISRTTKGRKGVHVMAGVGEATAQRLDDLWIPILQAHEGMSLPGGNFHPPDIEQFCTTCDRISPFHVVLSPGIQIQSRTRKPIRQVLCLAYQCQGCRDRTDPVVFLITRNGLRLTLTGRSQIEVIHVPRFIPQEIRDHYRAARLAFNCNQVLPALFMLRTMIEQHMRRAVGKQFDRGEELADAYNKTVQSGIRMEFPSLRAVYKSVSDALHEAREDADLFVGEIAKVERHLEACDLYRRNADATNRSR